MNFKIILFSSFVALFIYPKNAMSKSFFLKRINNKKHYHLKKTDSLYQNISFDKAKKKFNQKKFPEALEESLILFNKAVIEKDYSLQLKSVELLGDIYLKTSDYKNSLKYFKIALNLIEKKLLGEKKDGIKSSLNTPFAKIYLKMGSAYLRTYNNLKSNLSSEKKYPELNLTKVDLSETEENNLSSKEIKKFKDSALYFLTKLEKLPSTNDDILKYKASSHINLSAMYQLDSMYADAKNFAFKAIDIHQKRNDKIKLAKSYSNLGSVYLSEGNFNKAKTTYIQAIESIKKDNSHKATRLKANLYYNLAWAMRNLKDYKAYDFQELSNEIEDDLKENNLREILKKIEANNKENLEKQKVNLAREQRKLAEAQESKTNILFGALTLLVIIVSGVVIYNYKLRQKNLQLKLSENSLLQQQSIEKLKSEAHTKILNAAIDGKESERKEIAEILHDNVSALLSSANMHLSATKKQLHNNTPTEIEKTQSIILEASQKVRDLSHNLVSSILLKFGLEYAIKDVAKKYSNSELKFDVTANNINRYNQEFEIKIFNVIQELINNIIKHSKANNAEVILKEEKSQLTILVKDDGVGFSTSSSSLNDGIGLNQIEARVKMMNGKLTINSEINNGVVIFISVPIQQQKQANKLSSVS